MAEVRYERGRRERKDRTTTTTKIVLLALLALLVTKGIDIIKGSDRSIFIEQEESQ